MVSASGFGKGDAPQNLEIRRWRASPGKARAFAEDFRKLSPERAGISYQRERLEWAGPMAAPVTARRSRIRIPEASGGGRWQAAGGRWQVGDGTRMTPPARPDPRVHLRI
jgi:hypothetical protein